MYEMSLQESNCVIVASFGSLRAQNSRGCLSSQIPSASIQMVGRSQTVILVDGALKLLQKLHPFANLSLEWSNVKS